MPTLLVAVAVLLLAPAAAAPAFDPYPTLWSSNSIDPTALEAAGIKQKRVRNWSCHDSPPSYCTHPVTTGGDGSNCIRGRWQLITKTGTINGGVPEAANLTAHLEEVRRTLPLGVPENYTGLASIDFEDWAPIWSEDTSHDAWHSQAYQNLSISLVQQAQPSLSLAQATVIAQQQFEKAALAWFVETVKLCRSLRPKARWGYYGFPQSFTFKGYSDPTRGPILRQKNDKLQPLWDAVDVLQPSIYLAQWGASPPTLARMNAAQLNTTMDESVRLQRQTLSRPEIWPYQYFYYNSGKQNVTLTPEDTTISIEYPYDHGATGLVLWGDPLYKNRTVPGTVAQFQRYFADLLGPAVTAFKRKVDACAAQRCHGHGRCLLPLLDAIGAAADAAAGCECQPGYDPSTDCKSPL